MTHLRWLTLIVFGLCIGTATADIPGPGPRPRPRPQPQAPKLEIELDLKAKAPVLIISAGIIPNRPELLPRGIPPIGNPPIGDAPGAAPKDEEQGNAFDPTTDQAIREAFAQSLETTPTPRSQTSTLIAGLALSMAVVSGGFWLVRRNRRGGNLLGIAVVTITLAGGSLIWANVAPFPRPPEPVTIKLGASDVNIQMVPRGNVFKLVLDPTTWKQMLENAPAVKNR